MSGPHSYQSLKVDCLTWGEFCPCQLTKFGLQLSKDQDAIDLDHQHLSNSTDKIKIHKNNPSFSKCPSMTLTVLQAESSVTEPWSCCFFFVINWWILVFGLLISFCDVVVMELLQYLCWVFVFGHV